MGSKKTDLEIIYNLQWRNKPGNGGDKANIIGMYDIPATTLNWETFKSYLLKNSGTVGENVKVFYITDSNRQFPIESQTDFQIALYAFRRKARIGDIVNLKLEVVSAETVHKTRYSNDVETQSDNNGAMAFAPACCNGTTTPDWFVLYMNQFKKDIMDDVSSTMNSFISKVSPGFARLSRRSKPESSKRSRRLLPAPNFDLPCVETNELFKSFKLEEKLEKKLEKLEHKSEKIREKKLALFTKTGSDAGPSTSKPRPPPKEREDDLLKMDATAVNSQKTIPHMLGGEIYLHKWEVLNSGTSPWTSKTSLVYTWGSKALKPVDTVISVPYLNPGETGIISIKLHVPNQPGHYECYWHFRHKDRRFGHWLGCQLIVDPFDLKGHKSVLQTDVQRVKRVVPNLEEMYDIDVDVTRYDEPVTSSAAAHTYEAYKRDEDTKNQVLQSMVRELGSHMDELKLTDPTDTNCSSDSDNQSVASSSGLPEEFVVIPRENTKNKLAENKPPNCIEKADDLVTDSAPSNVAPLPENFDNNNNAGEADQNTGGETIEHAERVEDVASSCGSHKSDIVIVTLPDESEDQTGEYAFVIVEGRKLTVPKKIIKTEYLEAAEKVSKSNSLSKSGSPTFSVILDKDEEIIDVESVTPPPDPNNVIPDSVKFLREGYMSHCSAAGSSFSEVNTTAERNSRLFIFPQSCPGYEIYPADDFWPNLTNSCYDNTAPTTTGPMRDDTFRNFMEDFEVPAEPLNLSPYMEIPPQNIVSQIPVQVEDDLPSHVPNYQQTLPEQRTTPVHYNISGQDIPKDAFRMPLFPNVTTPNVVIHNANMPTNQPAAEPRPTAPEVNIPASAPPAENVVHILPETLVSGAVNVASSAINTARTVINMIRPTESATPPITVATPIQQGGRWENGHWVTTNPDSSREANLNALAEMGFWDRDLNATLLARYKDDLTRVVAELVQ